MTTEAGPHGGAALAPPAMRVFNERETHTRDHTHETDSKGHDVSVMVKHHLHRMRGLCAPHPTPPIRYRVAVPCRMNTTKHNTHDWAARSCYMYIYTHCDRLFRGLSANVRKLEGWIQAGCGDAAYDCAEKGATFAVDGVTPAEVLYPLLNTLVSSTSTALTLVTI